MILYISKDIFSHQNYNLLALHSQKHVILVTCSPPATCLLYKTGRSRKAELTPSCINKKRELVARWSCRKNIGFQPPQDQVVKENTRKNTHPLSLLCCLFHLLLKGWVCTVISSVPWLPGDNNASFCLNSAMADALSWCCNFSSHFSMKKSSQ